MDVSTLKAHLGDDLFAQVEAALKDVDGLTIIATNDGSWLPKTRLDEERKSLKGTIATLTQQLAEAKKAGDSAAALQTTVDSLTQQVKDRDATITGMKRSGKIQDALRKAKARDAAVVEKLLDASKIGEDDKGNLTGLEDQIKALKAGSAYLFEEEKGGKAGFGGGKDPSAGKGGSNNSNAEVNSAIRAAFGFTQE